MKRYSTFPRSLELELENQMQFSSVPWGSLTSLQAMQSEYSTHDCQGKCNDAYRNQVMITNNAFISFATVKNISFLTFQNIVLNSKIP